MRAQTASARLLARSAAECARRDDEITRQRFEIDALKAGDVGAALAAAQAARTAESDDGGDDVLAGELDAMRSAFEGKLAGKERELESVRAAHAGDVDRLERLLRAARRAEGGAARAAAADSVDTPRTDAGDASRPSRSFEGGGGGGRWVKK
jgi:hypothetical protein